MKRDRQKKKRTFVGHALGVLCWCGCVAAWAAVLAQMLGKHSWAVDQAATLAPQITGVLLVLFVVPIAARRWVCAAVGAAGVLASLALFVPGRAPGGSGEGRPMVRVLTMNTLGVNKTPELVVDMIAESGADVVVLVECSWRLWSLIQGDERISERLPFGSGPAHPKEWSRVKLSRWPLRPIELEQDERWGEMKWNYLFRRSHIIERPGGEFVLGGFVVRSPRSREWWVEGNEQLEENSTVIREYLAPLGLPIVIGADLNATPSGSRTDMLRTRAGLVRCKPLLDTRGTWPADNVPWARVAIDDVFVSGGVRRSRWRTIERETGSDHAPVLVDLLLPPPRNAHSERQSSDQ